MRALLRHVRCAQDMVRVSVGLIASATTLVMTQGVVASPQFVLETKIVV